MDKNEISKFIGQHGMWKTHLREAIDTGKSQINLTTAAQDDQCDFGKWLRGLPADARASNHFQSVSRLHAEFHREAARVLKLATAGNKAEANKATAMGGSFANASSSLTQEMTRWMNSTTTAP